MSKEKRDYCEKDAIGYQGFGCCSAYVCADHADRFVLDLKPGERKISGECVFERFSEPDRRPRDDRYPAEMRGVVLPKIPSGLISAPDYHFSWVSDRPVSGVF